MYLDVSKYTGGSDEKDSFWLGTYIDEKKYFFITLKCGNSLFYHSFSEI